MKKFFLFLIFLSLSCTKAVVTESPLRYSFMPSYLDIDSLMPYDLNDTARVVDSSFRDFKTVPIDPGLLITDFEDSLRLPGGLLISERKAALYLFYEAGYKRQSHELRYAKYLMEEQYDKAKSAEMLYQEEIKRLRKQNERSWLEQNMGYIGFVTGAAAVILIDFAVFQTAR